MLKPLVITLAFTLNAYAAEYDKTQEFYGVSLKSMKADAVRSYEGSAEKILSYTIDLVKKGVTNFSDKCNNAFRNKRKFTPKTSECRYHNENIVETFVVKDIRQMDYFKEVSEVYLLGRQIYNRGAYGFYELVTVREG